jgi:hypothetical protein
MLHVHDLKLHVSDDRLAATEGEKRQRRKDKDETKKTAIHS